MPESSDENAIHVFVYGTLLFPEITERLKIESNNSPELKRCSAILRGYDRLTVQGRDIGNPPAIFQAESDASVEGQVLIDITINSLERLDWFEDIQSGLYTRERVHVEPQGAASDVSAVYTYVCGERIRSMLSGAWNPEEFREQSLDWYLANVLPKEHLPWL